MTDEGSGGECGCRRDCGGVCGSEAGRTGVRGKEDESSREWKGCWVARMGVAGETKRVRAPVSPSNKPCNP